MQLQQSCYLLTLVQDRAAEFVIFFDRVPQCQRSMLRSLAANRMPVVQASDAKIWVESEQGAGSKFCFLLPVRPAGLPAGGAR
jgi:predicted ATPase